MRCISNIQKLIEQDSILWFVLCGWKFSEDQDDDIGSIGKIMTLVVTGH